MIIINVIINIIIIILIILRIIVMFQFCSLVLFSLLYICETTYSFCLNSGYVFLGGLTGVLIYSILKPVFDSLLRPTIKESSNP